MKTYLKGVVVAVALVVSGVLVSPSAQVVLQRGFATAYNLTVQNVASFADGSAAAPSIAFASEPTTGWFRNGAGDLRLSILGASRYAFQAADFFLLNDNGAINFGSGADVVIRRDAANTLAQRNGTAAQAFRVYNTFTDAANYERLNVRWTANDAFIETTAAGTGVARNLFVGTLGASTFYVMTGGTARWTFDTSGRLLGTTATGGLGYGVGAGGAVTQATSKATGVTLNTVTGNITTTADALAADAAVSFTLTDSAIAETDLVAVSHHSGGTAGAYTLTAQAAAGSAVITIRNVTAGALSEALVIKFAVIKGAVS